MKQMKNAMMLVFLAQGTPLLYSGDEFGNTQNGNNNPYCQDNDTAWIKWNQMESGGELLAMVRDKAAGPDAAGLYCCMVRSFVSLSSGSSANINGMEILMQFYFPTEVAPAEMLDILKYWKVEYHIDGQEIQASSHFSSASCAVW